MPFLRKMKNMAKIDVFYVKQAQAMTTAVTQSVFKIKWYTVQAW